MPGSDTAALLPDAISAPACANMADAIYAEEARGARVVATSTSDSEALGVGELCLGCKRLRAAESSKIEEGARRGGHERECRSGKG